jgi:hypothetical protein
MTTTTQNPKPRRLLFQFRLKTLFLIVAVLCVPLAWVGVRMNHKRQERAAIAEIERLGGTVEYDWQRVRVQGMPFTNPNGLPTGPGWLRWTLGDDFFSRVVYVGFQRSLDDEDIRRASTFSTVEELGLRHAEIGDEGLAYLQGLTHLRSLTLAHSNLTDAGLQHLKSLTTLKYLDLDRTMTTKEAVDDIAKALPGCTIEWP